MALLPIHREILREIRNELWIQGVYWKNGMPSELFKIIAPGVIYDPIYIERIENDRVNDPNNMVDLDKIFLHAIITRLELPTDFFDKEIHKDVYITKVIEKFIQKNYDKLLHIDKLDINIIDKEASSSEKVLLKSITRKKDYLPKNLQKQFDELEDNGIENSTSDIKTLVENAVKESKEEENYDINIKPEIELLQAYILYKEGKKRLLAKLKKIKFTSSPKVLTLRDFEHHRVEFCEKSKDKAINKFLSIDWKRQRRRTIEDNNQEDPQGDTGLLKKIKDNIIDIEIGDKLTWNNKELFYLITDDLEYTHNRLGSMSNWLKDDNSAHINDNEFKINIAQTLGFDSKLWDTWEEDKLETNDIIYECVEKLKQTYEENKPKTKITFSSDLPKYKNISDQQKSILSELALSTNASEVKKIIETSYNEDHISQDHENQIFLLKAADILYNKGEYIPLTEHIMPYLFEDIQAKTEIRYLKALIYSSDALNKPVQAYKIFEDIFDEEKYEDHQTIIISNALRSMLPKFSDDKYRKKTLIKLTEDYHITFDESKDYYPGINLAYMISLVQKLYPKSKLFKNFPIQDISISNIHNHVKKSLEKHQNSHNPKRLSKQFNKTNTLDKIADELELPVYIIIKYVKNAKLSLDTDFFRNVSEKDKIPEPYSQKIKTAIRNRHNRYWAYITEYEFRALRDTYDDFDKEELLEIIADLQPTKDQLSRTLRQLDFYVDMLSKGNNQPNESIIRLTNDLKGIIQ